MFASIRYYTGDMTTSAASFTVTDRPHDYLNMPDAPAAPLKKLSGKPLGTNLFIARLEPEEDVNALILRPDIAKRKSNEGRVISVGTKVSGIQSGDRIMFRKFAGTGTEVTFNGIEHLVIDQDQVLMVIEESE
jgi:chaperonin GroES